MYLINILFVLTHIHNIHIVHYYLKNYCEFKGSISGLLKDIVKFS